MTHVDPFFAGPFKLGNFNCLLELYSSRKCSCRCRNRPQLLLSPAHIYDMLHKLFCCTAPYERHSSLPSASKLDGRHVRAGACGSCKTTTNSLLLGHSTYNTTCRRSNFWFFICRSTSCADIIHSYKQRDAHVVWVSGQLQKDYLNENMRYVHRKQSGGTGQFAVSQSP